jgi:hypothetical protein
MDQRGTAVSHLNTPEEGSQQASKTVQNWYAIVSGNYEQVHVDTNRNKSKAQKPGDKPRQSIK